MRGACQRRRWRHQGSMVVCVEMSCGRQEGGGRVGGGYGSRLGVQEGGSDNGRRGHTDELKQASRASREDAFQMDHTKTTAEIHPERVDQPPQPVCHTDELQTLDRRWPVRSVETRGDLWVRTPWPSRSRGGGEKMAKATAAWEKVSQLRSSKAACDSL